MNQHLFQVNIEEVTKFLLTKNACEAQAWQERIFGEVVPLTFGQSPITEGHHQVVINTLRLVHSIAWSMTAEQQEVSFETAAYVKRLEENMKLHQQRELHFTSACLYQEMGRAIVDAMSPRISSVMIIGGDPFGAFPFDQSPLFGQSYENRPLGRFSILRTILGRRFGL